MLTVKARALTTMEAGEPSAKRIRHSILSEHVNNPEFERTFRENWENHSSINVDNLEVIAKPFRVCKIGNFIDDEGIVEEMKNELLDIKTQRNSTDLFQFEQSHELSTIDSTNLQQLSLTLRQEMISWMIKNTNIALNGKVSMSTSCYSDTDFLLCHDDNIGDRRIAFILYLTKNWTEDDGGSLDLIDTDENNLPRNVARSLLPEYNSFVFFEVAHNSYHQVAEITSDKTRWSINGWFHGPLPKVDRPIRSKTIIPYYGPEINKKLNLNAWISSEHLLDHKINDINAVLEKDSWVTIQDFLILETYEKLSEKIQSDAIKWKKVGPADIRNYEVAEEESLPEILADFCDIFKSLKFFNLLKLYSCMDLIPCKPGMHPKMTMELQRWSKGCYTLLHDELQTTTTTLTESLTVNDKSDLVDDLNISDLAKDAETNDKVSRLKKNIIIEESSSVSTTSGMGDGTLDSNTPPRSHDENDEEEWDKFSQTSSKTKASDKILLDSPVVNKIVYNKRGDFSRCNSEESDIDDYLSDHDGADSEGEESLEEAPGSLDLILHFNVDKQRSLSEDTIDYVDMTQNDKESVLCQVPVQDNFLSLVYKNSGICSTRKHLSHYFEGYYYTLICNYCE